MNFNCFYKGNINRDLELKLSAHIDVSKDSYFWSGVEMLGADYPVAYNLVVPSILSDLHKRVYLKLYEKSRNKLESNKEAIRYIQNNLYKGYSFTHSSLSFDASEYQTGGRINKVFEKIHKLADKKTNGDIDILLGIVAGQYSSIYLEGVGCSDLEVCALFFPERFNVLNDNPEFKYGVNGLDNWEVKKNHNHSSAVLSVSSIYESSDGDQAVNLSLNVVNDGNEQGGSYIDVYQEIQVKGEDLKQLALIIEANNTTGTNNAEIDLAQFSGAAGYYLMVTELGEDFPMYQLLYGSWLESTDARAEYFFSDIFEQRYWANLYAERIYNGETILFITPSTEISQNLPGSGIDDDKLYTVQYGATLFETYGSGYEGLCNCSADIEVSSIKLARFK